MNIDLRLDPPTYYVPGSKTHKVSSWLMHENAPKVEMPEALRRRLDKMKKEGYSMSKEPILVVEDLNSTLK